MAYDTVSTYQPLHFQTYTVSNQCNKKFKSIDLVINCGNIDNNSTIEEIEGKKFPTDSISLIFYKYISNSIVKETVDTLFTFLMAAPLILLAVVQSLQRGLCGLLNWLRCTC